jgi:signal transduction histidine kinase
LELLPVFSGKEVRSALKSLLGGETIRLRFSRWEGDGRERVYDLRGFPLRRRHSLRSKGPSPEGSECGARSKTWTNAVLILEDCTALAVESRLLERSRRLASLRGLAGRVSTSVGDFLRVIFSDETIRARRDLRERADRLDAVLQGLSKFAAPVGDLSAGQPLEVNDFLEELAVGQPGGREEAPRFRPQGIVRVDFRGQPGLWNVHVDRSALGEALLEVLENASDAVPERGTISIRTSNVRLESDPGLLAPGPYVEISVTDTGPGMNPAQLEQVLEPFYSTKPKDSSLGLGLSLAYGIARAYGGDVRVESQPGQGTTVRILLPARLG